jgi:peptidoglycan/xylan/chitin deacetylase (PgdA/CDA1 family)
MLTKYAYPSAGAPLTLRVLTIALAVTVVACGPENPGAEARSTLDADLATATGPITTDATAPSTHAPVTELPPNELGEIMVLEYHRLGEPETEFRRSEANFRGDLRRLYDAGYRPITVRQMVEGDLAVPYGATPVVFTIDDSSAGQFYFLDDGGIDPNSMLGIWEAFRAENPDWENGATWCVLPGADHPSNFFGELPSREVPREERESRIRRKVNYLVDNGHEICNHTLYHARLDRATGPAQVQEWIGRGEDSIRVYLPRDYDIVTFSLPLGMWPAERSLAWHGSYQGTAYDYAAILEVTGGPNASPFDRAFDPRSVKRLIVAPGHLERQMSAYERTPGRRYVSDGDPRTITVPDTAEIRVARERWPYHELRVVPSATLENGPPRGTT